MISLLSLISAIPTKRTDSTCLGIAGKTPICEPNASTQVAINQTLNIIWNPNFWDANESGKPGVGGVTIQLWALQQNRALDIFYGVVNDGSYPLPINSSYLLGDMNVTAYIMIAPVLENNSMGQSNNSDNFMLLQSPPAGATATPSASTSVSVSATSTPDNGGSGSGSGSGSSAIKIAVPIVVVLVLAILGGVFAVMYFRRRKSSPPQTSEIVRQGSIKATVKRSLSTRHAGGQGNGQFFDLDKVGQQSVHPVQEE